MAAQSDDSQWHCTEEHSRGKAVNRIDMCGNGKVKQ